MEYQEIKHLYWRAAFGASPSIIKRCEKLSRVQVVNSLLNHASFVEPIKIDTSQIDHIRPEDLKQDVKKRRDFIKKSRKLVLNLNSTILEQIINSPGSLEERMTLFWMNHFSCKDSNVYHVEQFINTLRINALGHFGDFLKAVSKEAAMLKYLNNKQNRKQKPNENFARELMELFTLGEGNFTESDVQESARAFTGYNHNFQGDFVLIQAHHDYGYKSFKGSRGRYDGDDIIDLILEDKQCALFICGKIYKYFVNPKANLNHIESMANVFFEDYSIEKLMHFVFTSDWFYDSQNIGAKIKSPIDLLTGISQTVPIKFDDPMDAIKIQKILGQTLLDPPNVAGWKGDKSWIDANTIMIRLKLPSLLLNNAIISLKEQGDFNDRFRERYYKRIRHKLPFKTLPYWESFMSGYNAVGVEQLADILIQGDINEGTMKYLSTLSKKSKRDYCIQLMSLPEYQMC